MPYQSGLVVERSKLDSRGRDSGDIAGKIEEIRGDMAEIGMLSRRSAGGGGVREVDTSVPEAVTELPNMEFGGIREGGELSKMIEGIAEVVVNGRREGLVGGGDGGEELHLLD